MIQNLPENQFEQMIFQQDKLRNKEQQIKQQQNDVDGEARKWFANQYQQQQQ